MDVPAKIEFAAQRLKAGHRVNRITVRDFLRHFGAERRGAAKVAAIRRILDSLDIKTEPDFETAWIDGPIWLQLRQGVQPCITDVSADDDNLGLDGTSLDEVVWKEPRRLYSKRRNNPNRLRYRPSSKNSKSHGDHGDAVD